MTSDTYLKSVLHMEKDKPTVLPRLPSLLLLPGISPTLYRAHSGLKTGFRPFFEKFRAREGRAAE